MFGRRGGYLTLFVISCLHLRREFYQVDKTEPRLHYTNPRACHFLEMLVLAKCSQTDCMPRTVCIEDHCVVLPCKFDKRNCPSGFVCIEDNFHNYGHCEPEEEAPKITVSGTSCSKNSPCPMKGERCFYNYGHGACR